MGYLGVGYTDLLLTSGAEPWMGRFGVAVVQPDLLGLTALFGSEARQPAWLYPHRRRAMEDTTCKRYHGPAPHHQLCEFMTRARPVPPGAKGVGGWGIGSSVDAHYSLYQVLRRIMRGGCSCGFH